MTDPAAVALKFGFIAVLYLFLLWVARSSLRDLRRREDYEAVPDEPERRGGVDARPPGRPRFEVIAAMGRQPGEPIPLTDGGTLGRAATCVVQIDDPYASSTHARVFARGEGMYIEDMGSTNGTYLNGHQLRRPEPLEPGDTVRVGDSEYRYEQ